MKKAVLKSVMLLSIAFLILILSGCSKEAASAKEIDGYYSGNHFFYLYGRTQLFYATVSITNIGGGKVTVKETINGGQAALPFTQMEFDAIVSVDPDVDNLVNFEATEASTGGRVNYGEVTSGSQLYLMTFSNGNSSHFEGTKQ